MPVPLLLPFRESLHEKSSAYRRLGCAGAGKTLPCWGEVVPGYYNVGGGGIHMFGLVNSIFGSCETIPDSAETELRNGTWAV